MIRRHRLRPAAAARRSVAGVVLHCTLGVALSLAGAARAHAAEASTRADQQFTNYGFAHEFGSGVYDFNGRTLQVYTLPFEWTAVEPGPGQPGIRLRLPVTLGFLDFRAADVIDSGLPDKVDSISFVPGVEFDVPVGEHWRVLPYVQAGRSVASDSNVSTDLFGAGAKAERAYEYRGWNGLFAGGVVYSRVRYDGEDLPDDDFVRWRASTLLARQTGLELRGHPLAGGPFATLDVYTDPPTGPTTGIDLPRVQFEVGYVVGPDPAWRLWKVPLPRIGLSYRFAGDVSAVRIVLGAPF